MYNERVEKMDLSKLEENIGYKFKNIDLLKKALTHTSYANENHIESNEKLEFLGDSILEFISSKYIYNNYSFLKEGEMTKVRADVVCEKSLHKVALKHNFSDFLYLGKSQIMSGETTRPAILADSVEAVIAAIYFDSGLDEAERFIVDNLKDAIDIASHNVGMKDYKTVLQEKLQVHGDVQIKYIILEEKGPDHDKTFVAQVSCNGKKLAIGNGKNKKSAEMDAAHKALQNLI
jgi:ribonuclease-3